MISMVNYSKRLPAGAIEVMYGFDHRPSSRQKTDIEIIFFQSVGKHVAKVLDVQDLFPFLLMEK